MKTQQKKMLKGAKISDSGKLLSFDLIDILTTIFFTNCSSFSLSFVYVYTIKRLDD